MNLTRLVAALLALAGVALAATAEAAPALPNVGLDRLSVPVSGDVALPVTLWYPSTSAAQVQTLGPYRLNVAIAGDPAARRMPLIVMSHGTGGSALESVDLAIALAKAGFVVAAVEHSGDNFRDRGRSFTRANFVARPREVSAMIDFLLTTWRHKGKVDPRRIGMFGHSAGGATSLIIGGGVLDWGQLLRYCVENQETWGCKSGRNLNPAASRADVNPEPVAAADPRVRALVIAAPALAHGFAPAGLTKVRIPVQLWVAGKDEIVPDAGQVTALLRARPDSRYVADAGHFSFLAPCPDGLRAAAPLVCVDRQGFDRPAFQQEFTRAIVRFFRAHLRG